MNKILIAIILSVFISSGNTLLLSQSNPGSIGLGHLMPTKINAVNGYECEGGGEIVSVFDSGTGFGLHVRLYERRTVVEGSFPCNSTGCDMDRYLFLPRRFIVTLPGRADAIFAKTGNLVLCFKDDQVVLIQDIHVNNTAEDPYILDVKLRESSEKDVSLDGYNYESDDDDYSLVYGKMSHVPCVRNDRRILKVDKNGVSITAYNLDNSDFRLFYAYLEKCFVIKSNYLQLYEQGLAYTYVDERYSWQRNPRYNEQKRRDIDRQQYDKLSMSMSEKGKEVYKSICKALPLDALKGKEFLLYETGHHGYLWIVIARENGKYLFYDGASPGRESTQRVPFDTIALINRNRRTLEWAFDSLPVCATEFLPEYGHEYTPFFTLLMLFGKEGECLFSQDGALRYYGPGSEEFNNNLSKLDYLFFWLLLGSHRDVMPFPNSSVSNNAS